jgi:hypothetical protein
MVHGAWMNLTALPKKLVKKLNDAYYFLSMDVVQLVVLCQPKIRFRQGGSVKTYAKFVIDDLISYEHNSIS